MQEQKDLIRITEEFLTDNIDYQKLRKAAEEYKTFLYQLCSCELDNETGRSDIQLSSGKALGTFWAALCIDDFIRTRQFIRGIDQAIREKRQHNDSIHVLYAGSGPFATLILPLILRHPKERVKYTLLDINPFSLEILNRLIARLELQEYKLEVICADATQYQLSSDTPDIIVSETMQNALAKEQQVPIFIHLMKQAKPDTVFIPEKIELSIGLQKDGDLLEFPFLEQYKKVDTVFEVSKEALHLVLQSKETAPGEIIFPENSLTLEKHVLKDYSQLVLLTEIKVFCNERINLNESGLTTPLIIDNIPENVNQSITVLSQYKICTEPKLDYQIVVG
ncbi:hypothetical protein INQ51_13315 [Maribellus sp. CM-23]|uniref:hypothetical protein n=1 Tax=Maribellus sp. CM-23 TaxID=2781026 RepID=UPI001F40453A|nr:hypothetical protein [Maribellus sp. CM-23]MCE4565290.1 hypothetical protein [Maribellus sp. CM-23]